MVDARSRGECCYSCSVVVASQAVCVTEATRLQNPHGQTRRYHTDVSFEVNTLPVYGSLYMVRCLSSPAHTCFFVAHSCVVGVGGWVSQWNATEAVLSGGFAIVEGRGKYLSACYRDCSARFGVGNALSTSPDGSITSINRYAL